MTLPLVAYPSPSASRYTANTNRLIDPSPPTSTINLSRHPHRIDPFLQLTIRGKHLRIRRRRHEEHKHVICHKPDIKMQKGVSSHVGDADGQPPLGGAISGVRGDHGLNEQLVCVTDGGKTHSSRREGTTCAGDKPRSPDRRPDRSICVRNSPDSCIVSSRRHCRKRLQSASRVAGGISTGM